MLNTPITLLTVDPIGTHRSAALLDYSDGTGGLGIIVDPQYPRSENGERLRTTRLNNALNLRDAAKLLRISASELSGLEYGKYTLSDLDWKRAMWCLKKGE